MTWTTQQAIEYIRTQLGHPVRKVELDQTQIQFALKKAIDKYVGIKPVIRGAWFLASAGVAGYNLTTMAKPYGRGILELYQEPITSPSAVFSEFEYYRLRQPAMVDMGEIVLDMMYYKEIGMITGTAFDWEWRPDATMLLLTPVPTRAMKIAYTYNMDPASIEDLAKNPVAQSWVVDYALAKVKIPLGRIRSKFKGIAGNEMAIELDGDALLAEGNEETKEMEEDLHKNRGDWVPPIHG